MMEASQTHEPGDHQVAFYDGTTQTLREGQATKAWSIEAFNQVHSLGHMFLVLADDENQARIIAQQINDYENKAIRWGLSVVRVEWVADGILFPIQDGKEAGLALKIAKTNPSWTPISDRLVAWTIRAYTGPSERDLYEVES